MDWDGTRLNLGADDVEFDDIGLDNVEVFPGLNIAIVYATGYITGEVGLDIGEAGDAWRFNKMFGGEKGVAPYTIINLTNEDGSIHDDYERLQTAFTRAYGTTDALQNKLREAEEAE